MAYDAEVKDVRGISHMGVVCFDFYRMFLAIIKRKGVVVKEVAARVSEYAASFAEAAEIYDIAWIAGGQRLSDAHE